jgi:hypothetical protein
VNEFFYSRDTQYANDPSARPGTALFALGLWIRLAFIGASIFIAAPVLLISEAARAGTATVIATAGAGLATTAWLRIRSALAQTEPLPRASVARAINP